MKQLANRHEIWLVKDKNGKHICKIIKRKEYCTMWYLEYLCSILASDSCHTRFRIREDDKFTNRKDELFYTVAEPDLIIKLIDCDRWPNGKNLKRLKAFLKNGKWPNDNQHELEEI